MADIVDAATRSRMMSGIRGKNTKPEIIVRKALHAGHTPMVSRTRHHELVCLKILMEHHLPRLWTRNPLTIGHLPFGRKKPANFGPYKIVDPVHWKKTPREVETPIALGPTLNQSIVRLNAT